MGNLLIHNKYVTDVIAPAARERVVKIEIAAYQDPSTGAGIGAKVKAFDERTGNRMKDYTIPLVTLDEVSRLHSMIRSLCSIIESEYPEDDERYQFAMNCLTDVGEK